MFNFKINRKRNYNKQNKIYYQNYKNYKILSICSIPKQVLLVSNRNINLMNSGVLNIGYINNVDLEIKSKSLFFPLRTICPFELSFDIKHL